MTVHLHSCVVISCPDLSNPDNGVVQFSSGTVFQSVAEYSCDDGYQIIGTSSLTCQANAQWSDSPPHCESKPNILYNLDYHNKIIVCIYSLCLLCFFTSHVAVTGL